MTYSLKLEVYSPKSKGAKSDFRLTTVDLTIGGSQGIHEKVFNYLIVN